MLCTKCSTELPDEAVACYRCGTVTDATFVKPLYSTEPIRVKEKVSVLNVVALILLGILTVAVVAFVIAYIVGNKATIAGNDQTVNSVPSIAVNQAALERKTAEPLNAPQMPPVTPDRSTTSNSQSQQFLNGELVVAADGARWWTFTVGTDGGRVSGNFEASGGIRGEIACYIAPANETQNLSRGLSSKVFFNSGRVHVGNVDQRLAAGDYVLMFRNDSPWTQRIVTGRISLMP